MKLTDAQKEDIKSMLGEGFHTAFRKGTDHPSSSEIHNLIGDLPDSTWGCIIDFVADPLIEMIEGWRQRKKTGGKNGR